MFEGGVGRAPRKNSYRFFEGLCVEAYIVEKRGLELKKAFWKNSPEGLKFSMA